MRRIAKGLKNKVMLLPSEKSPSQYKKVLEF